MNKINIFKKFTCLVLILTICGFLSAVDWGFKLGLNPASFRFSNDSIPSDFTTGYSLGAFISFDIARNISLQPEFFYYTTVSKIPGPQWGEPAYYKYKIPFYSFPLLIKFTIPSKTKLHPALFLGPYLAFRRDATFYRVVEHGESEVFGEREDVKQYFKKTDYGLIFGGNLEWGVCFGKIFIEARYSFGQANILSNPTGLSSLFMEAKLFYERQDLADMFALNDSIQTRSLMIIIGLSF